VHHRFGPVAIAFALALGGCGTLPAAGPATRDIVAEKPGVAGLAYQVVDVDQTVLGKLAGRRDDTFKGRFPERSGGASEAIGVGDYVAVTIWEASVGGLFSAGDSASKSATVPEQPVSSGGTIVVPYAGVIKVAGHTPTQVKTIVEQALAGKAIEPQVLVNVTRNATNTVTVIGEVVKGGVVPLAMPGSRILDALAAAGGISAPVNQVFLQLARGGRTVRVPLQTVLQDPGENVQLRPKDTVVALRDPQSFTIFGASGSSSRVEFDASGTTLDQALAKVGGLQTQQADPAAVFLFRFERPEIVGALDPTNADYRAGKQSIPIVYRVNLREASGLFVAKTLQLYDKDTIYVASAPSLELQKFFQLIGTLTQPLQSGLQTASAAEKLQ